MSQTSVSLRALLGEYSDGDKQIWATEFGAPTSGGSAAVSEARQATMLTDGLQRFSGYSWSGPLFLYSLQDKGTDPSDLEDWFGVIRADGSRKPAYARLAKMLEPQLQSSPSRTQEPVPGTAATTNADSAPTPNGAPSAPSAAATFTRPPDPVLVAPLVDGVDPGQGSVRGDSTVTISGVNLSWPAVTIYFADEPATSASSDANGALRGTGAVTGETVFIGVKDSGPASGNLVARFVDASEAPPDIPGPPAE
jgi:hypothetical protein